MDASLQRRRFLLGRGAAAIAEVGEACLERRGIVCRACGDACDRGAIAFLPVGGGARPLVDAGRCDACAQCVPVCPASAITVSSPA
jgi:ferredoxin-type protein NapF